MRELFDPLTVPLHGVNLIEASAGTGKTWSLATLFVRFLLGDATHPALPISQILVVTFTKAATAELYTRFREKIEAVLRALSHGTADEATQRLVAPYLIDTKRCQLAKGYLMDALDQFDQASIYTIHAFCQRVLSHYDPVTMHKDAYELVTDDTLLLVQLTTDFWRTHVLYDTEFAQVVARNNLTIEELLKVVRPYIGKPYLQKPAMPDQQDMQGVRQSLSDAWHQVEKHLEAGIATFWLLHEQALDKRYYRETTYQLFLAQLVLPAMRTMLTSGYPSLEKQFLHSLERLTTHRLIGCLKKNTDTKVDHPFFEAIAAFLDAYQLLDDAINQRLDALYLTLINWLDEALSLQVDQKQRRIDSLTSDLVQLLEQHPPLAKAMSDLWQAALIDEFQDTDPTQYRIFQLSLIQRGKVVFLVGDPKQAIYGFRSGDIFTYFAAKSDADYHYTLTHNYRSIPPLVAAVNTLFSRPQAFLLDIPFLPAQTTTVLGEVADNYPAMLWHDLTDSDKTQESQKYSKRSATELAADWTARRIATLLATQPRLVLDQDTRPLSSRDIAILVATHEQGNVMRDALAQYNIASACLTRRNVFESSEAVELLALLNAWYIPGNRIALHTVLATQILGLDAAAIKALDEKTIARYQVIFFEAHQRWLKHGPMTAWCFFMQSDRVAKRLLPMPDGERRLTNLTHLMELAQQYTEQTSASMEALMHWWQQNMCYPSAAQEQQERLDSDQDLVRVVTIHAAKGMQYPVVFCPFLWSSYVPRVEPKFWLYHVEHTAHLATKTTVSDEIKAKAKQEIFAEEIRKLYVALTRAKVRIEICWIKTQAAELSALTWLLNDTRFDRFFEKGVMNSMQWIDWVNSHSDNMAIHYANWDTPCAALPKAISQKIVPPQAAPIIRPAWQITSFSQLVDAAGDRVIPEDNLVSLAQDIAPSALANTLFPKGSRAGRCLHDLLQLIDFTAPSEALHLTIDQVLMRYGFSPKRWHESAYRLVCATLDVPLCGSHTLRQVAFSERLTEMGFIFPLKPLQAKALQALLINPDHQLHPDFQIAARQLNFEEMSGYLKGFIDLIVSFDGIFYIIDYKSHYLGDKMHDYASERLSTVMAHGHYYLQYLIYTVALRAYLASRQFPKKVGGVRYLFLRGLDQTGNGVWSDMPSEALLQALEALFCGDATVLH